MQTLRQICLKTLLGAAAVTASLSAAADPATITAIFGSGVANNDWTAGTGENGVELGLRARLRLPTPTNTVITDGAGTYMYNTGAHSLYGHDNLAEWNFDFSINAGSSMVSGYTYVLGLDFNPAAGTPASYIEFDPLGFFGDNSFGNSGTARGQGLEPGPNGPSTEQLAEQFSIAQNSQNFGWLASSFDPTVSGVYSIFLAAYNEDGLVARTDIDVVVGAVPEPTSLALLGIAGLGMVGVSRRRRTQA